MPRWEAQTVTCSARMRWRLKDADMSNYSTSLVIPRRRNRRTRAAPPVALEVKLPLPTRSGPKRSCLRSGCTRKELAAAAQRTVEQKLATLASAQSGSLSEVREAVAALLAASQARADVRPPASALFKLVAAQEERAARDATEGRSALSEHTVVLKAAANRATDAQWRRGDLVRQLARRVQEGGESAAMAMAQPRVKLDGLEETIEDETATVSRSEAAVVSDFKDLEAQAASAAVPVEMVVYSVGLAQKEQASRARVGEKELRLTAKRGSVEEVKALLQADAEVAAKGPDGSTALHLAAHAGCESTVKMVLAASDEVDVPRTF